MAGPVVLSRFNDESTADETAPAFTHPAVSAGDRVVLFVGKDGDLPVTGIGSLDWKQISSVCVLGQIRGHVYWRDCDGSEGSTTITFAGDSQNYVFFGVVLDAGTFEATLPPRAISEAAASGNANPSAVTPEWGSVETLYLTWVLVDGNSSVSGFPTSYSNTGSATSTDATTTDRVAHGWADREVNGTTEDPGAYTNTSTNRISFTVAIAPTAAVAETPQLVGFELFNSASQTPSFSANIPSDCVAVGHFAGYNGGTLTMSTLTLGGDSYDSIVQVAGDGDSYCGGRAVWAAPAAGAQTLAAGWSAGGITNTAAHFVLSYWSYVDTSGPIRDDDTYQGPGFVQSNPATADSEVTDSVIALGVAYIGGQPITAGDSSTQSRLAETGNQTGILFVRELLADSPSTTIEVTGEYATVVTTSIVFAAPGGADITGAFASSATAQTFAADGQVLISGAAASSSSAQAFVADGQVLIAGAMASASTAQEFAADGVVAISGALASAATAQEFEAAGQVFIAGALASSSTAQAFAADGQVFITGAFASQATAQVFAADDAAAPAGDGVSWPSVGAWPEENSLPDGLSYPTGVDWP